MQLRLKEDFSVRGRPTIHPGRSTTKPPKKMVKIFVPKERSSAETRVAATPETVKKLVKDGLEVWIEQGAGAKAHFPDSRYAEAGAQIASDPAALWREADMVLSVGPLGDDIPRSGAVAIGLLDPYGHPELVGRMASAGVTSLAMELIPRITRAQSMDALSSQANIAGYKAVLLAAHRLGRYFPLLMTAAGTIPPAKVIIMGAGVAGLQAIATAKRLGAVVEVSDIRPVVKEQVESLGGRFIDLPLAESGEGEGGYAKEMGEDFLRRQRDILTEHVSAADVVITTAQIPGKPAPTLLTRTMIEAMRPGAVVVDLAADQGGNCELTKAGEDVVHDGVLILGPSDIARTMSQDASVVYSRNVLELVHLLIKEGELVVDIEDEIIAGSLLTHDGEIKHQPTAEKLQERVQ
jgi:NAD(P) transhydrogenase subunit alpha